MTSESSTENLPDNVDPSATQQHRSKDDTIVTPKSLSDLTLDDGHQTTVFDYTKEGSLGNIGTYSLIGLLGRGAMGMVYRARDKEGAEVALKVLQATPNHSDTELSRFLREADSCKQLRRHPHIITVYDTGHVDEHHYIAMELVPDGLTLTHRLAEGVMDKARALKYGIAIAKALDYAHRTGIIHRDLKPQNILVSEFDEPLLADFGLSKSITSVDLTITGAILGTPKYMSPEQAGRGDHAMTEQSDIYSFGVVLYEMLTGQLPYEIREGCSLPEILNTIREKEPAPARKLNSEIDRNLEAVLIKLLEKSRNRRYQSMHDVVQDLEACLAGQRVSARIPSWGERFEKWLWKRKGVAITCMIASPIIALTFAALLQMKVERNALDTVITATTHQTQEHTAGNYELNEGETYLVDARESLAAGETGAAWTFLKLGHAWATDEGDQQLAHRFQRVLARMRMQRGQLDEAVTELSELRSVTPTTSIDGQLLIFELGAAQWLRGDTENAAQTFASLYVDNGDGSLDITIVSPYLKLMVHAMCETEKVAALKLAVSSFPSKSLHALGLWVLAERPGDGDAAVQSDAYRRQAIELAGDTLPWLERSAAGDRK